MKRTAAAVLAAAALTACTPDVDALMAWITTEEATASAEGLPCPIYADDLAWRGLPDHFLYVIQRESMCDPGAVNASSGALGLTQIMPFWLRDLCPAGIACTRDDLLDPERNLDAATYVYNAQGPSAWSQTW